MFNFIHTDSYVLKHVFCIYIWPKWLGFSNAFLKAILPSTPDKKSVQFEPGLAFPKILSSSTLSLSKWFAFNSMRCQRVFCRNFLRVVPQQDSKWWPTTWRMASCRRRRLPTTPTPSTTPSTLRTPLSWDRSRTEVCRDLEVPPTRGLKHFFLLLVVHSERFVARNSYFMKPPYFSWRHEKVLT